MKRPRSVLNIEMTIMQIYYSRNKSDGSYGVEHLSPALKYIIVAELLAKYPKLGGLASEDSWREINSGKKNVAVLLEDRDEKCMSLVDV